MLRGPKITTNTLIPTIQGLLEKQRKESAIRIDKLEQALSEIRKENNEVWHVIFVGIDDPPRTTDRGRVDGFDSPSTSHAFRHISGKSSLLLSTNQHCYCCCTHTPPSRLPPAPPPTPPPPPFAFVLTTP